MIAIAAKYDTDIVNSFHFYHFFQLLQLNCLSGSLSREQFSVNLL